MWEDLPCLCLERAGDQARDTSITAASRTPSLAAPRSSKALMLSRNALPKSRKETSNLFLARTDTGCRLDKRSNAEKIWHNGDNHKMSSQDNSSSQASRMALLHWHPQRGGAAGTRDLGGNDRGGTIRNHFGEFRDGGGGKSHRLCCPSTAPTARARLARVFTKPLHDLFMSALTISSG